MQLEQKLENLKTTIATYGQALIAFSGGVDSTFLLNITAQTLGPENTLAVIEAGPLLPRTQYESAKKLATAANVELITVDTNGLANQNIAANNPDRCYHCKIKIMSTLKTIAAERNIQYVLCGSNLDDLSDYRPGNKAVSELDIKTPLLDAGLTKPEIRQLSKDLNLPTSDMPSTPCLASRIAYGIEITPEKLNQIEQAESFLHSLGLKELRVRHHGDIARIELHTKDFDIATNEKSRAAITARLKELGFKYVTLDLTGFRSGSLNESLSDQQKNSNSN